MKGHLLPILSLAVVVLLCRSEASAFNIYQVGSVVIGQEHNEVWKRWFDKKFSIWVGAHGKKDENLIFKVETGLGDATVRVNYTKAVRDKLERAVTKAIEWSEVAKKNQADTTKGLGCFGNDLYEICEKDGNVFKENQMGLRFFAANGGTQTNLVIDIIDMNNQLIRATIHIDLPQMKQLLENSQSIETVMKKARETAGKEDLFKE